MKRRGSRRVKEKVLDITRPAYTLGLLGGVITFLVSIYVLTRVFQVTLLVHLLIGVLMLISVYLLRKEHHAFSGSVMLLCSSIIGLTIASGILIGPILGIIGGILGMAEHERLIRRNLD